jgi:hypothetical protein
MLQKHRSLFLTTTSPGLRALDAHVNARNSSRSSDPEAPLFPSMQVDFAGAFRIRSENILYCKRQAGKTAMTLLADRR